MTRERGDAAQAPLRSLLERFPDLRILKLREPGFAVVTMDSGTVSELRQRHPELSLDPDVRHRPAGSG